MLTRNRPRELTRSENRGKLKFFHIYLDCSDILFNFAASK